MQIARSLIRTNVTEAILRLGLLSRDYQEYFTLVSNVRRMPG